MLLTDTQTDRQTNRQTNKQTNKQTDKLWQKHNLLDGGNKYLGGGESSMRRQTSGEKGETGGGRGGQTDGW